MDTQQEDNELDSLEGQGTLVEPDSAQSGGSIPDIGSNSSVTEPPSPINKPGFTTRIRSFISHINVYVLFFILILIIAAAVVVISVDRNRKNDKANSTDTQLLTPEALSQLNSSEAKVGDPKQTLNIESNAVFTGKVLIRDNLDVAGAIKVGGPLNLPGITVSGTSTFDTVQINSLSIAGNTSIQGQLNIQKTLTVSGGASFGGPVSAPQLSITTLQLSGDLQINRHIDAGGNTPGKSDGSALGSGGTSSVSGTDTAGTVTINIGGGPPAGCFVTINFSQRFNSTPHVTITPVGSVAANLNYYINRSTTSFSICATNSASAGSSFSFDYIVID